MNSQIRTRGGFAVVAALLLLGSIAAPSSAYPRPGRIEYLSGARAPERDCAADITVTTEGNRNDPEAVRDSTISNNGRYVAFDSLYCDLVPFDDNGRRDIFRLDRKRGKVEMVTVSALGTASAYSPGDTAFGIGSYSPAISGNGRFVAFSSDAINLTPDVIPPAFTGRNIFVRDMRTGRTELITKLLELPASSSALTLDFQRPAISDNGRYVVFEGHAQLLGLEDATLFHSDILFHDRRTGKTKIVSVDSEGRQGQSITNATFSPGAYCPSISGNGRFVTFDSPANDYVADDTHIWWDVFLHDLQKETTVRASVGTGGSQADKGTLGTNSCGSLDINDDVSKAGLVTFSSGLTDFVPNDGNARTFDSGMDVFVHDKTSQRTDRVSVNSWGEEYGTLPTPNGGHSSSISPDGRYVTFMGPVDLASPREAGQIEATYRGTAAFLYDRETFSLERIAFDELNPACGVDFGGNDRLRFDYSGDISPGGRFLTFLTCAPLSSSDDREADPGYESSTQQSLFDAYLWDRGTPLGVGASNAQRAAAPRITGLGAFTRKGYTSVTDATGDLLASPVKGAELVGVSLAHRPQLGDVFFKIDLEHMPGPRGGPLPLAGNPLLVYGVSFTYEGRAYEVRVAKTGVDPSFGLFSCEGDACEQIATLRGGYGTMGDSVAVSLPLDEIDFEPGGELTSASAFSALGSFTTGATEILDRVAVSR